MAKEGPMVGEAYNDSEHGEGSIVEEEVTPAQVTKVVQNEVHPSTEELDKEQMEDSPEENDSKYKQANKESDIDDSEGFDIVDEDEKYDKEKGKQLEEAKNVSESENTEDKQLNQKYEGPKEEDNSKYEEPNEEVDKEPDISDDEGFNIDNENEIDRMLVSYPKRYSIVVVIVVIFPLFAGHNPPFT
eukprot:Gb_12841 [translate_table: standard]